MKTLKIINSPCINQCVLDKELICIGCFRSADEILDWNSMSQIEKEKANKRIALRRKNKSNL